MRKWSELLANQSELKLCSARLKVCALSERMRHGVENELQCQRKACRKEDVWRSSKISRLIVRVVRQVNKQM